MLLMTYFAQSATAAATGFAIPLIIRPLAVRGGLPAILLSAIAFRLALEWHVAGADAASQWCQSLVREALAIGRVLGSPVWSDGALAVSGSVRAGVLAALRSEPFFWFGSALACAAMAAWPDMLAQTAAFVRRRALQWWGSIRRLRHDLRWPRPRAVAAPISAWGAPEPPWEPPWAVPQPPWTAAEPRQTAAPVAIDPVWRFDPATATAEAPAPETRRAPSRALRWLRLGVLWSALAATTAMAAVAAYGAVLLHRLDITRDSVSARADTVETEGIAANLARRPFDAALAMPLSLPPERIPAFVSDIVAFREDRHFRSHPGVNPFAIARALGANVYGRLTGQGRRALGASTITMQLVKNLLLSRERSIFRKIDEALLALYIEANFSKDEIMAMYLNKAYFGDGVFGIEAATRHFFGRSVGYEPKIDQLEAAMLAISLQAPSRSNPFRQGQVVENRARRLLANMQGADAARTPRRPRGWRHWRLQPEAFRDLTMRHLLPPAIAGSETTLIKGLTINPEAQLYAERAARQLLADHRATEHDSSVVLIMRLDGAIVALALGHDYDGEDLVHRGRVSPGSTLKPFMTLCALERGMRAADIVTDAPQDWPAGWPRNWPRNADGRWRGPMPLGDALAASRNPPFIELFARFGSGCFGDVVSRSGIGDIDVSQPTVLLGSEPVALLDLAAAYGRIATGDRGLTPHAIAYARDRRGRMVFTHPAAAGQADPAFDDRARCALLGMLRDATRAGGTGRDAAFAHPVWGKTGTSTGHRDALFVGFTGHYLAVVWVGRRQPGQPARGAMSGGGPPAQQFRHMMATLHEGLPVIGSTCD